ncbi:hypothetical protein GCM10027360_36060 [Amycolatopsis echigonensis]
MDGGGNFRYWGSGLGGSACVSARRLAATLQVGVCGGAPRSPSVLTVRGCLSRRERCLDKHPQTAEEASYRGAGVVWVPGELGASVAVGGAA